MLELPPPRYPALAAVRRHARRRSRKRLDAACSRWASSTTRGTCIRSDTRCSRPPPAVARAEALRRAGATRASIYAVEVARAGLPDDYLPRLLPRLVRELLYPRYFHDDDRAGRAAHGADPRLVLSIMREESRFNPRRESPAAARGLLQFIITTAREVGQALGLVDVAARTSTTPTVIIQLGARYVGDLQREFGGDRYKTAAAYNAGPNQATLWARMAPGPGRRLLPVRDQLRRDQGLRAEGAEQLRAVRRDLRGAPARRRRARRSPSAAPAGADP